MQDKGISGGVFIAAVRIALRRRLNSRLIVDWLVNVPLFVFSALRCSR